MTKIFFFFAEFANFICSKTLFDNRNLKIINNYKIINFVDPKEKKN